MIRLQRLVAQPRGTLDERIVAAAAFRKGYDVPHAGAPQHQRHQAIEAERDARVRRTARPQHLEQVRELGQPGRGQFEDVVQNVQLQRGMVDPAAAAAELDTVHHEVVVVGYREFGIGGEHVDVFGAAWRGEGVVSGGQSLAGVVG